MTSEPAEEAVHAARMIVACSAAMEERPRLENGLHERLHPMRAHRSSFESIAVRVL
jgi:hypothetical protein